MNKIVLATTNKGKIKELKAMLNHLDIELLSLSDFPDLPPVLEDGDTFEKNATKKADAVYQATSLPALADDSGLEVDCLNGDPGVYSARYAGENATDEQNNAKLLSELAGIPKENRSARFRCSLSYINEEGNLYIFNGSCEGIIEEMPSGSGGFGYDPIFIVPEYGKSMAELTAEEKNAISHRAKALSQFVSWLQSQR